MYTQKLIDARLAAKSLRKTDLTIDAQDLPAHDKFIQKIDRITVQMRKANPERYWVDGSAEYRVMTDAWQAERDMRAALRKAAA